MQILLFNLAAFAGACAQGLTGFGSGTITATLMVLVFPFREVIPVVAMVVLVPNFMLMWLTRHEMDWRRGPVAAIGIATGVLIGAQLLAILPVELLRRGLGGVILIYVVLALTRAPTPEQAPAPGLGDDVSLGASALISGVIVGAVGVAPIPLLIYVSLRYPKATTRSVLTLAFLFGTLTQNTIYFHLGLLTPDLALIALATVPGITLGLLVGNRWHYHVNQKTFGRALALVLILPAARLLVS